MRAVALCHPQTETDRGPPPLSERWRPPVCFGRLKKAALQPFPSPRRSQHRLPDRRAREVNFSYDEGGGDGSRVAFSLT